MVGAVRLMAPRCQSWRSVTVPASFIRDDFKNDLRWPRPEFSPQLTSSVWRAGIGNIIVIYPGRLYNMGRANQVYASNCVIPMTEIGTQRDQLGICPARSAIRRILPILDECWCLLRRIIMVSQLASGKCRPGEAAAGNALAHHQAALPAHLGWWESSQQLIKPARIHSQVVYL